MVLSRFSGQHFSHRPAVGLAAFGDGQLGEREDVCGDFPGSEARGGPSRNNLGAVAIRGGATVASGETPHQLACPLGNLRV